MFCTEPISCQCGQADGTSSKLTMRGYNTRAKLVIPQITTGQRTDKQWREFVICPAEDTILDDIARG